MSKAAHPILYSFRRCPYAMRTRMTLLASDQTCELREVVLRDKPAEMIQASATATVPVLVEPDGTVRDESLQIMLWALRRQDPLRWLQPELGTLSDMLALIERFDSEFKHHLDRYKYANRYGQIEPLEHRNAGAAMLTELNTQLQAADFLFGSKLALADVAIAPFVRQFANTDKSWFDAQPWHRLHPWLNSILSSEFFERSMRKYIQWQPGTTGPILA